MKGLNETLGADERKVLANEIDGIIKGMLDTVNAQDRGRYIFSGLKTDIKPFTLSSSKVDVTDIWVNVRAQLNTIDSPPTMTVNGVNVTPSETSAGSGVYLLSPTTTPASPLPGVTIQADTNQDPIEYTINGTQVAIVKGNPVYPGITTNLKIDIPAGDTDYPSYQKDTVVFNGDANTIQRYIAPNEMMSVSINGGAFGLTPYTDISTIPSTTLQTSDLFNTLISVRDTLNNADYLTPHTLTGSTPPYTPLINTSTLTSKTSAEPPDRSVLKAAYDSLISANDNVSLQQTYLGGRMKQLTNTTDRMDAAALSIKSLISQKSEVNMAEALSEVQNQSTVYQAVLTMSGRTNTTITLFDVLK
jgi:flagellin-like hook-associated protein FlgL